MRLQLEEMGATGMSDRDVAALTAGTMDAMYAVSLALEETGLTESPLYPGRGDPAVRGRDGGSCSGGGGGGGGGGSSSSFMVTPFGGSQRLVFCGICLERMPATDFTPCSGAGCTHAFCTRCLHAHVVSHISDRRYPIPCADASCTAPLPYEVCGALVAGTGATQAILSKLHIMATCMAQLKYCANPACATPFDFELDVLAAGARNNRDPSDSYRVTCPLCNTDTCVRCCAPWHEAMTCAAHRRSRDGSDALMELAQARAWKACPGCGVLIDKVLGDCNFVRHQACGTGFCFRCGLKYLSQGSTAQNAHGKPACQCGLWDKEVGPRPNNVRRVDRADAVLDLPSLLQDVSFRVRYLPNRILQDFQNYTCCYECCRREFASLAALAAHLQMTCKHNVHFCCGRPFLTMDAMRAHQRDAIAEEHVWFSFEVEV
ncbi:hypothetical protein MMPV_009218 [Pyropia vietnamensis]